jgi:hypothetical protein
VLWAKAWVLLLTCCVALVRFLASLELTSLCKWGGLDDMVPNA